MALCGAPEAGGVKRGYFFVVTASEQGELRRAREARVEHACGCRTASASCFGACVPLTGAGVQRLDGQRLEVLRHRHHADPCNVAESLYDLCCEVPDCSGGGTRPQARTAVVKL